MDAADIRHLQRAIRLAMQGRGSVEPNPMVGCVIVKDGRIIGKGWHQKYGGPHAEPNALSACSESPAEGTVYVTLEPCCHVNKQTPPCVPRLIEAKVARVVIGCEDPNPLVTGKGAAELRAAGIQVDTGACEAEAKQLVTPFIARMTLSRPYVTLKWAQTADGKVAGPNGTRMRISNATTDRVTHRLRAACDSILVGAPTVIADDPLLTARGVDATRQPARFVIDREIRIPVKSRLFENPDAPTTVFCALGLDDDRLRKCDALLDRCVRFTKMLPGSDGHLPLSHIVSSIREDWQCADLLVESGPALARALFAAALVDRVWVIRSPMTEPDESVTGSIDLGGDVLTEYLNPASPVFFAPERSADLILASSDF
jgi:diaminohydroxyphosphoribosylaminopyrimidine deaminase/5-amino-6-(5-phosphoribosylamino)uracil reductase